MIKKILTVMLLLAGCSKGEQDINVAQTGSDLLVNNSAAQLKLYTFNCGDIHVTDLDVFASSGDYVGQQKHLANTCYLIRHAEGDLIWDLGLPAELAGAGALVNGPFSLTLASTLQDQLAQIGISAADIEFISISHSHFDHTGQAVMFPDATWLVHQDEYQFMFSTEESNEQNSAFAVFERTEFRGNYDVFGDGLVVILEMPGHTPGHTALQLTMPESGIILLTGDLYHMSKSRKLRLVPRFNTNEAETRESMMLFESIASELGARVIIQHEPEDVALLPKPPQFLQ